MKKLAGDIDYLGWEVMTGIDFSLAPYQNLCSEIRQAVIGSGKIWSGTNSTQRKAFTIDKQLGESQNYISEEMPLFTKVIFQDIRKCFKQT